MHVQSSYNFDGLGGKIKHFTSLPYFMQQITISYFRRKRCKKNIIKRTLNFLPLTLWSICNMLTRIGRFYTYFPYPVNPSPFQFLSLQIPKHV